MKWLKINNDIINIIDSEHQLSIDGKWVTSYFTIDSKESENLDIIYHLYDSRVIFDWEDNKTKGFSSMIKSIDLFNSILSFQIRSKEIQIKDKSEEREDKINELLDKNRK